MKSTKEFFQNKKILIYGYGKTGKSAFNFLKTKNNLKVFDDNLPLTNLPYNKKFTRGSDRVRNFDYVLLSPGINYRKCLLSNEIIKNKEKIISDLDVFYKSFPENFFITITGTNGKSTTCKLLYQVLKSQGIHTKLVGNIGKSILSNYHFTKKTLFVVEASSYQIEYSKYYKTNFAAILNVFMRKIIIFAVLNLSIFMGFSQANDIDILALELAFQKQDSLKIETSLKLIKSLYDANEYDRALKYIIKSEKLSNTLNYQKGIAGITYYKSLIYAQKGDYINAISGYNKSKSLFNELSDTINIAKVNNSIGLIEIKRGNYARGLQFSLAAIKELEKRNLINELNLAYSNLAEAYYNVNASDKAIEFYSKAAEIQEQLNDTKRINESYNRLAELFSEKKEHRKAIEYYEKVLNGSKSQNDSISGHIYPKLGGEYLKFHDYYFHYYH